MTLLSLEENSQQFKKIRGHLLRQPLIRPLQKLITKHFL